MFRVLLLLLFQTSFYHLVSLNDKQKNKGYLIELILNKGIKRSQKRANRHTAVKLILKFTEFSGQIVVSPS